MFFNIGNETCTYDLLLQVKDKNSTELLCSAWVKTFLSKSFALDPSFLHHHRISTSHTPSSPFVLWVMFFIVSEKRIKDTCNYTTSALYCVAFIMSLLHLLNNNYTVVMSLSVSKLLSPMLMFYILPVRRQRKKAI